MSTHSEQLEDDDREPERVMIWGSDDGSEVQTLKFRGRVLRDADPTEVPLAAIDDLEAVGIYERNGRLLRYENARMIDIANHATRVMHRSNCTGGIDSCTREEAVVGFGEILLSGAWRVEFEERLVFADEVHDKARKPAAASADNRYRESHEGGSLGQTQSDHRADLGFALCGIGSGVDLEGTTAAVAESEDLAFSTLSDPFAEADWLAVNEQER
jgi:hypothetical protein